MIKYISILYNIYQKMILYIHETVHDYLFITFFISSTLSLYRESSSLMIDLFPFVSLSETSVLECIFERNLPRS